MAERKNTGLAVSDAKRLNDCYRELSEAIAARPAIKGDRDLWQYDYAALPGGPDGADREDWKRRCGAKDIALVTLCGAVTNGNLQLWAYGSQGETKVDRHELKELTFHTFASGTYRPDNRCLDNAELADTPLWVKEADWHRYIADFWTVRYGIDSPNPAPPADKPLLPPEGQFVTLSHALTWIAFGVSMDNEQLHEVLTHDRYGKCDPQEAIKDAVVWLADLGTGGKIAMRGKYRSGRHDDEKTLSTESIEPIRLTDYRQFSHLDDELHHGDGLLFGRKEDGTILDGIVGDRRNDYYLQVTVDRLDLLREFRPHGALELKAEAVLWSDLGSAELERAKELARDAQADEWWIWPQAVAWVGCRNLEHIATMRLCAEPWKRDRSDLAVALGAEHFLGTAYCPNLEAAERDLYRAIERGAIRTLGRATVDSLAHELKPSDWRGGKVVYNRTATLVSAANLLSEWACDVAINRADLWREFPAANGGIDCENSTQKPSKGRTKGTGYQRADAPLLQRMAQAIARDPALNPTSAAKLMADDAKGASFAAKVDRLSRAYRAGRKRE